MNIHHFESLLEINMQGFKETRLEQEMENNFEPVFERYFRFCSFSSRIWNHPGVNVKKRYIFVTDAKDK
jgi:hypothetical protein